LSVRSEKSSKQYAAQPNFPLTRESLAKLRLKAVRRGCWFRDLKRKERMLLDLTIRVVERVRSFLLAKVVSRLVSILCEAMESRVYRLIRTEGLRMAEELSEIAQSWGYMAAKSWRKDRGFMQYLTVSNLLWSRP
jgi:hypothetical protein